MVQKSNQSILLIEDAPDYQLLIRTALEKEYNLTVVGTGNSGLALLSQSEFDLVIVDIVLPDSDGYKICREIRDHSLNKNVPIIFVSSKDQISDKLMAFTLGANDYLIKPFNLGELKARVKANIGRPHIPTISPEQEYILFPPFEIRLDSKRLYLEIDKNKREISLTKKEFEILNLLVQNPDRAFTRNQILEKVWGNALQVTERTIDTHICKLRAKIQPHDIAIEQIHGVGYRFNPNKINIPKTA